MMIFILCYIIIGICFASSDLLYNYDKHNKFINECVINLIIFIVCILIWPSILIETIHNNYKNH